MSHSLHVFESGNRSLCLHCCQSVTNREGVVYITLYICELVILHKKNEEEKSSCDIARQPGCK